MTRKLRLTIVRRFSTNHHPSSTRTHVSPSQRASSCCSILHPVNYDDIPDCSRRRTEWTLPEADIPRHRRLNICTISFLDRLTLRLEATTNPSPDDHIATKLDTRRFVASKSWLWTGVAFSWQITSSSRRLSSRVERAPEPQWRPASCVRSSKRR